MIESMFEFRIFSFSTMLKKKKKKKNCGEKGEAIEKKRDTRDFGVV